jgi:hypothetical protein
MAKFKNYMFYIRYNKVYKSGAFFKSRSLDNKILNYHYTMVDEIQKG